LLFLHIAFDVGLEKPRVYCGSGHVCDNI
jgi:hypothetical protein